MIKETVTAALVIIGDEILSGRTKDENMNFLAVSLGEMGINLKEVHVVIDGEEEIVEAINVLRKKYDYVFTSGGVGPTHDDITSAAITKAFDDEYLINEEAKTILENYYGHGNLNEALLKMAFMPSKATLIQNEINAVSGFKIENVFVLAGIPKIFRIMFEGAKKDLQGGAKTKMQEVKIALTESVIAKDFANLQQKYPQIIMGSYPGEGTTSLVFRGTDYETLEKSVNEMISILKNLQSDSVLTVVKS
jgi:molybdenum cofactor synthesis domain-containing protein